MLSLLLAADDMHSLTETSFLQILRYVLFFLVIASAIVIIICVLLQSNDADNGNPITGIQESYYSKNKGSTRDGKLKIVTIVFACLIAVCTIVYFITELFNFTRV